MVDDIESVVIEPSADAVVLEQHNLSRMETDDLVITDMGRR